MLNLYNGQEQKEHIDTVLESLLLKKGYKQSFTNEFKHLAILYASIAVALVTVYLDATTKFLDTKHLIGACCLVYYLLQGAAYIYKQKVLKNAFFIGEFNGNQISVASFNKSTTSEYRVVVGVNNKFTEKVFTLMDFVDERGVVSIDGLEEIVKMAERKNE